MYRIRRFGVIRTATVAAALYAVIVFVFFVFVAVIVLLFGTAAGDLGGASRGFGPAFGAVGAIGVLFFGLLAALIYAAIGWIFTAIGCLVYNLVAGWTGGIEVEVTPVGPPPAAPPAWPAMSPPTAPPPPPGGPVPPSGP